MSAWEGHPRSQQNYCYELNTITSVATFGQKNSTVFASCVNTILRLCANEFINKIIAEMKWDVNVSGTDAKWKTKSWTNEINNKKTLLRAFILWSASAEIHETIWYNAWWEQLSGGEIINCLCMWPRTIKNGTQEVSVWGTNCHQLVEVIYTAVRYFYELWRLWIWEHNEEWKNESAGAWSVDYLSNGRQRRRFTYLP